MKLESRPSPRHPELMITPDGRIYDSENGKWLSVHTQHGTSLKGPVAYWTTNGKTYTLAVAKLVYETYISKEQIRNEWVIDFKNGNELDLSLSNLKKTKRWEKESKEMRNFSHDSWMGGNDIYIL